VAHRTEPAPPLDRAATEAFLAKALALAPKYRTELLLGDAFAEPGADTVTPG
jgi:hypothetical protein